MLAWDLGFRVWGLELWQGFGFWSAPFYSWLFSCIPLCTKKKADPRLESLWEL